MTAVAEQALLDVDELWFESTRLLGEREGCPAVLRSAPQERGADMSVDRDRQLDELAQHAFDSVPKHPVLLEKVNGDLAQGLEIVEQAADEGEASLNDPGVKLARAHPVISSRSIARNRSVSRRSMMAAICALAKSPGLR